MRRGRSSISDFFANFNAAYDATSKVGRDIELANVADAKPEESTGFTQEQGQELDNIAKQGFNNITFDDATKSYVAKNAAGEAKTIAQQGVTDFMGQRYAGQGQQVQNNAKNMAIAGVFDRYDPEAGMNMRAKANDLAFQAKQRERTEKDWASEDSIKAIDNEMGAALKASMVDKDGQPVQVTPDMYLANIQQRAGRLAQAGHSKQAQEAMQQFYGMADVKLRLDSKQREQDAIPAMTAFKSGNTQALVDYYNKYVPGGAKISSIERTKDGAYVISSAGPGGESLPSRTLDERGMLAMAQSLNDPKALLQHAWDEANYGLRLRSEKRADNADRRAAGADARAAAAHGIAMEDRRERLAEKRELFSVREALAREADPAISDAKLRAVRAGVLPAPGAEKGKTDIDVTMVRKFFTPEKGTLGAVHDAKGEAEFWDFVGKNNFRTTDQALMSYVQRERPRKIGSLSEANNLPSGARFVDPNGVVRMKP